MQLQQTKNMVLFPSGQPATQKNRDHCTAHLIACGADLIRFLDGPWSSLEQFVRYISRLDEIVSGRVPPYVVLTQTNPLKLVVMPVREKLCKDIVNLKLALWIIYVDPEEDPFFFANAAKSGTFDLVDEDAGGDPVRVWTPSQKTADGTRESYIVLTPQTARDKYFKARIESLWEDTLVRAPEPVTASRLRATLAMLDAEQASRRR